MQQLILRAGLALAIGVCACGGDKHEGRHHTSAEAPAIAPETRYRVELFPDDHGIGGDAPLVGCPYDAERRGEHACGE